MDEQPSVSFGPRLARLRQAAGLSQQALADRLSVTPAGGVQLGTGADRP